MGQVVFEGSAPYQALDATDASASAKNRMVEVAFQVAAEEGATKVIVLRLDPDSALALSQHLVPIVMTARHQAVSS